MPVGLGKEIRRGPFSAGASISVYGILEGGFGVHQPDRSTYLAVVGRVGVIAEIFGAVDFGIARAAVALRVWAELGLKIETGEPIIIWVEAGVSVHVRVVIATIRVWRCTIEIAVNFSFQTQVSFRWNSRTLDILYEIQKHGSWKNRSKWKAGRLWPQSVSVPSTLALDAAILDPGEKKRGKRRLKQARTTNIPVELRIVPLATLLGDPGEKAGADLVSALFLWALSLRKQNSNLSRQTPYTLSREDELSRTDFDAFASRIEQPRTLSAGVHALDYTTIAAFLSLNFDVSIDTGAGGLNSSGRAAKGYPYTASARSCIANGRRPSPVVSRFKCCS